jgi:predicted permease
MDAIRLDLRHAARRLVRAPAFTIVSVLTLGLGIGANTAIFSLVDQVLLRPLPVRDPDRLVLVDTPGPRRGFSTANKSSPTAQSNPFYLELRDKTTVFDGLLAYFPMAMHAGTEGRTELVGGELVSGTYFGTLGLAPAAGRLLAPSDDVSRGGHPVAVLSHAFWTRRFAAASDVLGRTLTVNGTSLTIVGVAPAGYRGMELGRDVAVFVPLAMKAQMTPTWDKMDDRSAYWLTVAGRLKRGVDRKQAEAALNVLYRQTLAEDVKLLADISAARRERFLAKTLILLPGASGPSGFREGAQAPLNILMAMSLTVLLIACANVANLQLSQAATRAREIAVRLSVGASRRRLVRQLLVESALLAACGGVLGVVAGVWAGGFLVRALPDDTARTVLSASVDARVLAFSLALCGVSVLLCGLAPALQSTRPSLVPALKEGGRSVAGSVGVGFLRKGLVVSQVALSLLLLVGAGLMSRSLANLKAVDLGFRAESLLGFAVSPDLNAYDDQRKQQVFARIQEALESLPDVESASLVDTTLLTDSVSSSTIAVEGYTQKEGENLNPHFEVIGRGFFATLGIPFAAGRDFDPRDAAGAPKVAIVNETFARYFFGGAQAALGRRFSLAKREEEKIEIVGVVRDSKTATLRISPRVVYRPLLQEKDLGGMQYYVRGRGSAAALAGPVRDTVTRIDPQLPVQGMKTMPRQVAEALFPERLLASLSGSFGVLATMLAALGLYGVMSLSVGQRSREMGVRIALGAAPRDILGLVLGEVGKLCAVGLALGLPAGLAAGWLLRSQLFGLAPYDPGTLGLMVLVLGVTALVAGYGPAARAARADPMVTLHYE